MSTDTKAAAGAAPKVVLGMPAYNRPDVMARTLESLLTQTYQDFALVIVEDHPSAETAAIAARYAAIWPRITYERAAVRLGMIGNWRRVFELGRQLYPSSEYFAWVSDHDVWHASWLEAMVAVLDAQPEIVLAYPQSLRMTRDDIRRSNKIFETAGLRRPVDRLRRSARTMPAGDMIYGLMRVEALARAGVFRHVLTPDRQVLLALSLFGEVKQVPEVMWYREVLRAFDVARQRQVFFPNGVPAYAYLPSHLQHCAVLAWDLAVLGRGRPELGRLAGLHCAAVQIWSTMRYQIASPRSAWRESLERHAMGRWLSSLLPVGPTVASDADTEQNPDLDRAGVRS